MYLTTKIIIVFAITFIAAITIIALLTTNVLHPSLQSQSSQCSVNANCSNGACGRQTARDGAPLVCCPSNNNIDYAGFDYCTDMPNGSQCWLDRMCGSGNCKGNAYGLFKGVCS